MQTGLADIAEFVIGDRGYRRLYASRTIHRSAASPYGAGAQTLVRQTESDVLACIYFPDAMIRHLEANPPQRGLNADNTAPFATFVEEIDHLLLIAECASLRRGVSLFEMELHANVSKYLVLSRFLAGKRNRLAPQQRIWLRDQLFDKNQFHDADAGVRERYRDAAHWAARFVGCLALLEPAARLEALRRFHAADSRTKLELIDNL
jgi:hypothetical protein